MGDALAELAVNLGILGDALEATVERWNAMVEAGHDDDYGPGDNYYDIYWGDPAHKGKKEATLGKFEGGPYHAAEVRSGALGTKGGPQTDTHGPGASPRLETDRRALRGGQCHGLDDGHDLWRRRGTLGPGMVFGCLAGKHAAQRNATATAPQLA